jgi:hypothetical protein
VCNFGVFSVIKFREWTHLVCSHLVATYKLLRQINPAVSQR